jgi:hypothetical protein
MYRKYPVGIQSFEKLRTGGFLYVDDLPTFIEAIKTFFAGVPFQWEKDNKN